MSVFDLDNSNIKLKNKGRLYQVIIEYGTVVNADIQFEVGSLDSNLDFVSDGVDSLHLEGVDFDTFILDTEKDGVEVAAQNTLEKAKGKGMIKKVLGSVSSKVSIPAPTPAKKTVLETLMFWK